MIRRNAIALSAGLACLVLGPIYVRSLTESPADRLGVSVMLAGVVALLFLGFQRR